MPNKSNQIKRGKRVLKRIKEERMANCRRSQSRVKTYNPKKLKVLCNIAIEKYKLGRFVRKQQLKKFNKAPLEPTSCTVVGGKPLRKRKPDSVPLPSTSAQPHKIKRNKKSGAGGDADEEGEDKKKGRPVKKLKREIEVKPMWREIQVKPRSGPKKYFPEISVTAADINPEPEVRIKVETDPDVQERDPFAPDEEEDYTVVVKEEFEADEVTLSGPSTSATSDISPRKVTLPTLIRSQTVRSSSSSLPSATTTGPPLMTVVGDEMQIFANSVAEQLRAFPLDRALLLQLEIQTMLDNERQLLMDSN